MNAIEVRDLTKRFKDVTAVDGVSFSVRKGELFGLLGPNGAGKTTTINMLSTLLRPTSGEATVGGVAVTRDTAGVRMKIGMVFQETALDGRLSGRENLEFHAMMYDMDRREMDMKVPELLELVDLEDRAEAMVETYSGGMKRRLEIARGLMHTPEVLFLDEPTLGLDARTRRTIWSYIRRLNREKGVTIILTTHYMEEADYLCNRVAIMSEGRISALDRPRRLKGVLGGDIITLGFLEGGDVNGFVKGLGAKRWVRRTRRHNGRVRLVVRNGERRIPELIDSARAAGLSISYVNLHQPSLEDVFLYHTGRSMGAGENGVNGVNGGGGGDGMRGRDGRKERNVGDPNPCGKGKGRGDRGKVGGRGNGGQGKAERDRTLRREGEMWG